MRSSPHLSPFTRSAAIAIASTLAAYFACGGFVLAQVGQYSSGPSPSAPSFNPPQVRPGGPQQFSPRPNLPPDPRPGAGNQNPIRQPGQTNPNQSFDRIPGGNRPGQLGQLGQLGQPSPYSARTFGGQPAIPAPIRGPEFRNPLAWRAQLPPQISRTQAAQIQLPYGTPPGTGWAEVNRLAAGGNVTALQQQLNNRLAGNRSLDGLMTAVTALERAKASSDALNPYRNEALALAQQQMRAGSKQPLPWLATARFALEDQNDALFRQTTADMLQRFPDNPQANYFEGVRAIQDHDWRSAESALLKARDLGMSDESLAQLLKMAIDNQRWVWQYAKVLTVLFVVWALCLVAIVVVGRILSRRTLRVIQSTDQAPADALDRWTRTAYRAVVSLASIYYFISLPVLLLLAIALPLALGYALLMTPYLNLWLVAFVLIGGIGGIVTAISGLRTVLIRISDAGLGRSLSPGEAPKFWQLVRDVASDVGTRPVDDIWVTPGVDMAVLERGSWHERMKDRGERVLLIGVGLLPGFKTDAMRSVLAHEYAHFLHRDTAGGDVALRVHVSMNRFIGAIMNRGPVRAWDVTAQFLRYFVPLYYRLTLGASRMQEVLADRMAVERYGASSLIDGFHHVVRRHIEFQHLTSKAVTDAIRGGEAKAAFYNPAKNIVGDDRLDIEAETLDALQQPTTEFDSHPGMMERITLARQLGVDRPIGPGLVITLFGENVRNLARDMAQMIHDDVKLQARQVCDHDAEMLKHINRAIEAQPSLELLEARATIHYRQGHIQKAVDDLNEILKHCPGDLMTLISRSNVFESERQYARTVEDLRRIRGHANELPRDLRFQVVLRLGNCLHRLGETKEAALAFDEALRLAPNSLNAVLGRLNAAAELGTLRGENEQLLLQRAIATWPHLSILDPFAEAGGLAKSLAKQRQREGLRAPNAARPPIEEPARISPALYAVAASVVAIAVAVGGYNWWKASTDGGSETIVAAADAPATNPPTSESSVPNASAVEPIADTSPLAETAETTISAPPETEVATPTSTETAATANVVPINPETSSPTEEEHVVVEAIPATNDAVDNAAPDDASSIEPVADEPAVEEPIAEQPASEPESTPPIAEPPAEPQLEAPAPVAEAAPPQVRPIRQARPQPPRPETTLVHIPTSRRRAPRRPSRANAKENETVDNQLKQIALAMHNHVSVYRTFPVAMNRKWRDANDHPFLSWRVHLLLFLEQSTLHSQFHLDEPWDSPHNLALARHMPDIYRSSPHDSEKTRFTTIVADHSIFGDEQSLSFARVVDGAANTILLVQAPPSAAVVWTKPDDMSVELAQARRPWGRATRGIPCVMADGRPLRLPGTVPNDLLAALITARGKEVIDGGTVRRYAASQFGLPPVLPSQAHTYEQHNLKQIGYAMHNYHDSRKQFPRAGVLPDGTTGRGIELSWRVHLLPYFEQGNLYRQFHFDEPWDSPHNKSLIEFMPDVYRDADDPADSTTTRIVVMTGRGTPFVDRSRGLNRRQFSDGASNTILALQAGDKHAVTWTKPDDLAFDPNHPLTVLDGIDPRVGLLVVMADGAVRTLSPGIDEEEFIQLVTPAGGELVTAE